MSNNLGKEIKEKRISIETINTKQYFW
jgi:hypothetical protein